jgi:hypothetical protein
MKMATFKRPADRPKTLSLKSKRARAAETILPYLPEGRMAQALTCGNYELPRTSSLPRRAMMNNVKSDRRSLSLPKESRAGEKNEKAPPTEQFIDLTDDQEDSQLEVDFDIF